MRRLNNNNYTNHLVSMNKTVKYLVAAVIITAIIFSSGIGAGLLSDVNTIVGYYIIAMIVLIAMIYFNHADNAFGRVLFALMAPVFALVDHYSPFRNHEWTTPIISVILVALLQNLIQGL